MGLEIVLMLVWLHYISDYVFDIDLVYKKRDRVKKNVLTHSFSYSLPFLLIGTVFAGVTFVAHLIVDFFESKIRSKVSYSTDIDQWQGKYLNYVIIGADQMAHITILLLTYTLLDKYNLMM